MHLSGKFYAKHFFVKKSIDMIRFMQFNKMLKKQNFKV